MECQIGLILTQLVDEEERHVENGEKKAIPISSRRIEFLQHYFLHHICQLLDLFWGANALDHVDLHERHFETGSERQDSFSNANNSVI